ncbi:excinuclease ABC subunit UvrC [Candidatus Woesearchaeota archaeon]|jgi:excinuclease ABC subunit C|nr:excinuclease ABC subunit UvrC [Candidatus Woesearchaeota archaeon]MBT4387864.1 excinuclease ABC subunit UvrC [Candidatus Woesearchaeota archaeon]MBT4595683.1 excinuclease ABC subunit UvrC [Candidatus Woesearchaeota archaeon]MBT5740698.1 excinuclease ABC subunit UvrC [Candidatus Woesearchaeota archaeon]MBT7296925.1 excinuclease ABC subunit UvrC [Candidatus Woesearchaeota archaeon]
MNKLLENAPTNPGVYIFKNKSKKIIYIGKAKNIKNRISNYFQKNIENKKTKKLSNQIDSVDFIITNNEMEALILENNLINIHKPKYNIDLKDNIRHAYIQITKHEYPKLLISRKKNNKDIFFGPIPIGFSRNEVIKVIRTIFKIRNCNVLPKKVCLQYHINQCSGPCQNFISKSNYDLDVKNAIKFLKGDKDEVILDFENKMNEFSKIKNFEMAKLYRDRIYALKNISLDQIVQKTNKFDSDFINYYIAGELIYIVVMRMKKGIIIKKDNFHFDLIDGVLEHFLLDYYNKNEIPGFIYISKESKEFNINFKLYETLFSNKSKHKIKIVLPERGDNLKILNLVKENVLLNIQNKNIVLVELQKQLKLKSYPDIIDCFDISTLQGNFNVGACVRFIDTNPYKSAYRKFIIKSLKQGEQNDFQAIKEVISRRYSRLKNEQIHLNQIDENKRKQVLMPDLIIIDGGKQQLNMAILALNDLNLKIPIISLAKKEEEIYFPGIPIPLKFNKNLNFMKLITYTRDSVHNYVINFHRKKRNEQFTKSILSEISGLGQKTLFNLLNEFNDINTLKKTSILKINLIVKNKILSKKIFDYLKGI